MNKHNLRLRLKEQRQQLLMRQADFRTTQQQMSVHLEQFFDQISQDNGVSQSLLGYVPMKGEMCFFDLYFKLFRQGWHIYLPCVIDQNSALAFIEYRSIDLDQNKPYQSLKKKDAMGMLYPDESPTQNEISYALIPALGVCLFQSKLYRLGYGGGFYDRTLGAYSNMLKIAVAPSNGLVSFFPDPHDVALNAWLNEHAIEIFNSKLNV